MLNFNSEEFTAPISKFEAMLKTNQVLFFDAQEFESIVQYYIEYGKLNLADQAIEIGMNQHPSNGELLLLKSEILIFEGKFKRSLEVIEIAEQLIPEHEEIFLQKATIASKSKQHNEAVKFLKRALELTQDPFEIWNLLGMEYLIIEDFISAKHYFQLCLNEDYHDYQSLYNLLHAYDQLNDSEGAIKTLNSILEKDPYSEIAWHQLGKIYCSQQKFKEAISAFEFAIISDDKFTGAYIEIAKILEKIGKINMAIENYHIALKINDPCAFVYYRIARCFKKLKNEILLIDYSKKAIKVDPTFEKSWIELINLYFEKGDHNTALIYAKKAFESNRDSSEITYKLAKILFKLKKYSDAAYYFENVIDIDINQEKTWCYLFDCLIILNRLNYAKMMIKKYLNIFSDNSKIIFRLAIIEMKLGNNSLSKKYIKSIDSSYINQLFKDDLYSNYKHIV